jgi:hypothetical protein
MFENIRPLDPRKEKIKRRLLIVIPVAIALAGYAFWNYKNYAQENYADQFFQALTEKRYEDAYKLWQPSRYYHMKDFLADWGDQREGGPITHYYIRRSRTRGTGVVLDVVVNKGETMRIWVDREKKSLSFPPF